MRRCWKTSLAGMYVPEFCRHWALLLKNIAPTGAHMTPGRPALETCWQSWLMQASNSPATPYLPTPSCPMKYTSGRELILLASHTVQCDVLFSSLAYGPTSHHHMLSKDGKTRSRSGVTGRWAHQNRPAARSTLASPRNPCQLLAASLLEAMGDLRLRRQVPLLRCSTPHPVTRVPGAKA